jgi:hypothetical protein
LVVSAFIVPTLAYSERFFFSRFQLSHEQNNVIVSGVYEHSFQSDVITVRQDKCVAVVVLLSTARHSLLSAFNSRPSTYSHALSCLPFFLHTFRNHPAE